MTTWQEEVHGTTLVALHGVGKTFRGADGAPRPVLEGVDFELHDGEIVALLGKSGSGKSTLLRIISGLIPADAGEVSYRGQRVTEPVGGIAMVFQSFALFPWLTVQQNVELGLEAEGVAPDERERRADAALDLMGLGGFGGALPRELSGGMRQRVGIARALVLEPDVLLMDEAFSALDVLTGETLRDDVLELWSARKLATRSMVVVSHNIEEAVVMADRILILSSGPGHIRQEIPVGLPRPRLAESPEVRALVDEVYGQMTNRPVSTGAPTQGVPLTYRLPDADVGRMEAVLDLLADAPFHGKADLPRLAEAAELPDEVLFPTYEALGILGLVQVEHGDIAITALGRHYVSASQETKEEIFGQQLLTRVPLAARMRQALEAAPEGAVSTRPFVELLEHALKAEEAARVLQVAIEWGRYGGVYAYDYHTGMLSLPEDETR